MALLAPHFKLKATMSPKSVEEREYMSHVPYASAVGSLMYVLVYKTRFVTNRQYG